ncbi:MAG: Hsp20 family protein [Gammaproteobacteria bacterium]|nr:Hsp20 family protein [Gammaproteobacteria bacterium]
MNTLAALPVRRGIGPIGDIDAWMEQLFHPLLSDERGAALTPPLDVVEKEDAYDVRVELPGVKQKDVDISLQDGVLTVNARSESRDSEKEDGRVIRRELRSGEFVRSLRFGTAVDDARARANFADGILEIHLPKASEAQPKRIEIKAD